MGAWAGKSAVAATYDAQIARAAVRRALPPSQGATHISAHVLTMYRSRRSSSEITPSIWGAGRAPRSVGRAPRSVGRAPRS
eukprot:3906649-Pleurochrysis_carterae.AAC.2